MRTIQVPFPLVLFESSEPMANSPSRLSQSVRLKCDEKMNCFSPLDEYMSKWTNGKKFCSGFIKCSFPFLVYLYYFVPRPVFCFWNRVLAGPLFLPTFYA